MITNPINPGHLLEIFSCQEGMTHLQNSWRRTRSTWPPTLCSFLQEIWWKLQAPTDHVAVSTPLKPAFGWLPPRRGVPAYVRTVPIAAKSLSTVKPSAWLRRSCAVASYRPQPFSVDLIDRQILSSKEQVKAVRARYGRHLGPRIYTPDFCISWSGARKTALEVKTAGYQGEEQYEERLRRAGEVLSAMDMNSQK